MCLIAKSLPLRSAARRKVLSPYRFPPSSPTVEFYVLCTCAQRWTYTMCLVCGQRDIFSSGPSLASARCCRQVNRGDDSGGIGNTAAFSTLSRRSKCAVVDCSAGPCREADNVERTSDTSCSSSVGDDFLVWWRFRMIVKVALSVCVCTS